MFDLGCCLIRFKILEKPELAPRSFNRQIPFPPRLGFRPLREFRLNTYAGDLTICAQLDVQFPQMLGPCDIGGPWYDLGFASRIACAA